MARKQNPMLAKIEARHQIELSRSRMFVLQQCKDMMLVAANEAFGFGPERAKKLGDTFDKVWLEFATMTVEDSKYDKDIWNTKEKLDRKLSEILGEHFVPWDERYS